MSSSPFFVVPTAPMWIVSDLRLLLRGQVYESIPSTQASRPHAIWSPVHIRSSEDSGDVDTDSSVVGENGLSTILSKEQSQKWYLDNYGRVVSRFSYEDGDIYEALFNHFNQQSTVFAVEKCPEKKSSVRPLPYELDVPDIVNEYATLFMHAPFTPDLIGADSSQQYHVLQLASDFLSLHKDPRSIRIGQPANDNAAWIINRIQSPSFPDKLNSGVLAKALPSIRIAYLREWKTLSAQKKLAPCAGFDHVTGSQRACKCLTQNCAAIVKGIQAEELKVAFQICSTTLYWVMKLLLRATPELLPCVNTRKERMRRWLLLVSEDAAIFSEMFSDIFFAFRGEVDLQAMLATTSWKRALTAVMVRLMDDILLYQVAQGSGTRVFSEWIVQNFTGIVTGKGVCRSFDVTESLPLRAKTIL